MGTTADLAGLVRNARDADSSPFVLTGASHSWSRDALTGLAEAIQLTNARFDELGSSTPHLTPRGPASQLNGVDVVDDGEIADWFRVLADTLTSFGWTGSIQPAIWEDRPSEHASNTPWLATTMALTGWAHVRKQVVVPPWTAIPSVVPTLVDLVMSWVSAVDGALWFDAMTPVRGSTVAVRAALTARLLGGSGSTFCDVWCQTEGHERRARFSSYGHLTLEERSAAELAARLAALRSVSLPWASRVDRTCTTGDVGPSHPSWFMELARRERSDKRPSWYYPHGRHLDARKVPDVCVEQVLTGEHLEVARGLPGWHVEEVAADRFLVTHPDPSAWFLPAPERADRTRVDPDVLARARADFGPMILTDADR